MTNSTPAALAWNMPRFPEHVGLCSGVGGSTAPIGAWHRQQRGGNRGYACADDSGYFSLLLNRWCHSQAGRDAAQASAWSLCTCICRNRPDHVQLRLSGKCRSSETVCIRRLASHVRTVDSGACRGTPALQMNNRIQELRLHRGWSQSELAARLDVSRQTINALERARYDPSLPLAFRIASLFELSIEDIFRP